MTHRHRGEGAEGENRDEASVSLSVGDFVRKQRQLADLSVRQMAELTQVSNAFSAPPAVPASRTAIRTLVSSVPFAIPGGLTLTSVTCT